MQDDDDKDANLKADVALVRVSPPDADGFCSLGVVADYVWPILETARVVLAEVKGPVAAYTLKGDEIYVRAKVISSKPHPNPSQRGDVESAWIQPVVPGAR